MKHLLILLLFTSGAYAQTSTTPLRLYWANSNQIIYADSVGTIKKTLPISQVVFVEAGNFVSVQTQGSGQYYTLANFRKSDNTPWSLSSVSAAIKAFTDSAPTSGTASGGGSGFAAATIGTVPIVTTDYPVSTSATPTLTGFFKVRLYNNGSTAGTFSYGGSSYTIVAGEMWEFKQEPDPKNTALLVPLSALTFSTGTTTYKVIKYPNQ